MFESLTVRYSMHIGLFLNDNKSKKSKKMAKNLRTILPVTDMAVGRYRGQSLFWKPGPEGYQHGAGQKCSTYTVGGIDRMHWAVPTGSRIATFEIWGGGGNGGGARCCQQGIPGGSGAYARKTIKVTPGDTYVFCTCIAVHCCYYTESNHNRSQRGGNGCKFDQYGG